MSAKALQEAARKLHLDRMSDRVRERITLRQSALTYADTELAGYDAAVLMEVVEHVDPSRLPALENSVFTVARPATVLVTTPNVEYNPLFETLPEGQMRHSDHRFEWTRAEFREWAGGVAARRATPCVMCRSGRRTPNAAHRPRWPFSAWGTELMELKIPDLCLVVLIGASGSGKSTFARKHFLPTQILSSDYFRGLVADDENDQSASAAAFDVLHYVAAKRLEAGRVTVIDATNVQAPDRAKLVEVARRSNVLPSRSSWTPEDVCLKRNAERPDRDFGAHVVKRHRAALRGR